MCVVTVAGEAREVLAMRDAVRLRLRAGAARGARGAETGVNASGAAGPGVVPAAQRQPARGRRRLQQRVHLPRARLPLPDKTRILTLLSSTFSVGCPHHQRLIVMKALLEQSILGSLNTFELLYGTNVDVGQAAQLCVFSLGMPYLYLGVLMRVFSIRCAEKMYRKYPCIMRTPTFKPQMWYFFNTPTHIQIYPHIMHTPSFDVKILVKKVRIVRGYLRYSSIV